eukprot:jgi/Tetstr1/446677/TSEL_003616.t1
MMRSLLLRQPVRAMAAAPAQPPPSAAAMVAVKKRVASAIQKGVPLYNDGNVAGCEKVYLETYAALLEDPECQQLERVTELLTAQMDTLEADRPDMNAWQLRHGFDAIMDMYDTEAPVHSAPAEAPALAEVLALAKVETHTTATVFWPMNDDVMGGMSESEVVFSEEENSGAFVGTVRTENNGGFASCQLRLPQSFARMSDYDGFYVDCCCPEEADAAKVFQFMAKDAEALATQVNFKVPFRAPAGSERRRVLIPFSAFDRPEQMGRRVHRPELNTEAVREVGIMVLRPDVGPFRLLLREVGIYKL